MNVLNLTIATLLATAVTSNAAQPATEWPSELKIGEAIIEGKPKSADWKFVAGELKERPEGLQITCDQSNPRLSYNSSLVPPLALQFGILNLFENHIVNISLSKTYQLQFNAQFSTVTLFKKADGEASKEILSQNWDELKTATQPTDSCLVTMKTDGSSLHIWIGKTKFYEGILPSNLTDLSVEISSGWKSDWTLTSFTTAKLQN